MSLDRPLARTDLDRAVESVDEASWKWLRGRRVFMTGGTGFVGKWLLSTLLAADRRFGLDCRVMLLSRDPAAFARTFPSLANDPAVEWLKGDVRDFVPATVGRCDLVIHAATDVIAKAAPLALFDACVSGTRRVLDLALTQGAGRLLLVSSGAVYGEQSGDCPAVPETHAGAPRTTDPASAYGQGKRAAEWLATAYGAEHGLDTRIARCFAFVGPYQPLDGPFAMGNFLGAALRREPIVVNGDGTAQRAYLHAADMAAWLWAIALRGPRGGVYNVGGSEAVSIGQLAERVSNLLGSDQPVTIRFRPMAGLAPARYVPSIDKALAELSLPSPLALDEAILRTAAWLREVPAGPAAQFPTLTAS